MESFRLFSLIPLLLVVAAPANAQTIEWATPADGDWNVAANWDPANVPDMMGESAELGLAGTYSATLDTSPSIDSLSVSNSAVTLLMQAGRTLELAGVSNDGLINVNFLGTSTPAIVQFNQSGTLAGSGELRLFGSGNRSQLNAPDGVTITHVLGHTITGRGQINATLVNDGVIEADVSAGTMVLQTNAKTNNHILRAITGATLDIEGIAVAQGAMGLVEADAATVRLTGASTISGGTLATSNGGIFERPSPETSTLTDVTLQGDLDILSSGAITVTGAGLTNNGLIRVNSNNLSGNALVRFDQTGTLDGSGELRLVSGGDNSQLNTGASVTVTNTADHTISGRGQINASLVSNGLVRADTSSGTLVLQTNAKTNNGTMAARNNATLSIFADVDGSGGWTADAGTITLQSGVQISTMGSVDIEADGFVQMLASNNELTGSDLTITDTGRLSANGAVTLSGNLDLRSTDEADFTWASGSSLTMTGGTGVGCSTASWAYLEIGSMDNGAGGTGTNNFGLRGLVIDDGAAVTLSDFRDNGNRGGGGEPEALYATSWTLGAGAMLNLNGLNLYVGGAQITPGRLGGGEVVDSPVFLAGDMNCDGLVDGDDVQAFVFAILDPDAYAAQFPDCNLCAGDIDADGDTDVDDAPHFVAKLLNE